ncbi:uncharacterized protein TM35_000071520 [Trypanosoma theileri]|uniref:Uncharacterized protein n=1 Tax=Trypanosoma theileri TaxID=67003 RepID=A0A1X0P1M1_9TRYP|nr:uncharacterized protein TM35_000071520 [Trypanosoma theileri]ORC90728.1 hypothetical protein TM35_000071520 [Trypanosoma theileri]
MERILMKEEGQSECNTRDAFTTALLRRAANNLGVQYTVGCTQRSNSAIVNDLEVVKDEIRSRERVFGVMDASLIPLFIRAGDLSSLCESSLGFYKKALDVLDENNAVANDSLRIGDVSVSGYADLGSRFFQHGEYVLARDAFRAAASICQEKVTSASAPFFKSHSDGCCDPEDVERLRGRLRESQKGALGRRVPSNPVREVGGNEGKLTGMRDVEELQRLVEYIFDPANEGDGSNIQYKC